MSMKKAKDSVYWQLKLINWSKRSAVMRGRTMLLQGRQMVPGRVADIRFPPIYGVCHRKLPHDLVPLDLGDDRGGGDRKRDPVAADDAGDRAGQIGCPIA